MHSRDPSDPDRARIHRFGVFELDADLFELRREGKAVAIQRKAFDILWCLVESRGVVTRAGLTELTPEFTSNGSSFGYEMMLHAARLRVSLVQVPVKYLPRVGESSVTGDRVKTFRLGMSMIGLCLRHRFLRSTRSATH